MKKKKILIVDDDPNAIYQLKGFLESNGFEILSANDGEAALQIVKETALDLILLDIIMPKIDGFTVAKRIRCDPQTKDIPNAYDAIRRQRIFQLLFSLPEME